MYVRGYLQGSENGRVVTIGIAPAPIDAWWRSCTISYSFGTFAEMLGRLPNL
jgi:hypothetical protein